MEKLKREIILDLIVAGTVVLLFEGVSFIDRLYYGIHGLKLIDLQLIGYLVATFLLFFIYKYLWCENSFVYISRFWLLSALAWSILIIYGNGLLKVWENITLLYTIIVFGAMGVWVSLVAGAAVWLRIRHMVVVFTTLIVITPIIIGPFLDEDIVWLGNSMEDPDVRITTLVLLFDEMNASDIDGMRKLLLNRGLEVQMVPVKAVHGSTTEVIPAIFSNNNFEGARPCSVTRVCSKTVALDFAKVSVERNDVDVVGFHHPYCAIGGLRYCKRLITERSLFDWNRWACSLMSRVGFKSFGYDKSCQKNSHAAWLSMREGVISALSNAPSLKYGGVLFAHIPLPHPPATHTGSLADQYRRNLIEAENLLLHLLKNLDASNIEPRILIFSDHPLRQSLWCEREAHQFDSPCDVERELVDDYVPLLVAGRSKLPSIENIKSNQQVFDVLRSWLNQ